MDGGFVRGSIVVWVFQGSKIVEWGELGRLIHVLGVSHPFVENEASPTSATLCGLWFEMMNFTMRCDGLAVKIRHM
jgi:hypothetical protein